MAHRTPNYAKIFDLLKAETIDKQVTNFLEVYLVLNGARPATLIPIELENIASLYEFLAPYNVQLFHYKNKNFFVVKRRALAANTALFKSIQADPLGDHPAIGRILGYMTPLNIFAPRSSSLNAFLVVEGETRDGPLYKAQIAPQVVMGKTEDEVKAYFAPLIAALNALKDQTAVVTIDKITTVIEASGPRSGRKTRRGRRKCRKTRRN